MALENVFKSIESIKYNNHLYKIRRELMADDSAPHLELHFAFDLPIFKIDSLSNSPSEPQHKKQMQEHFKRLYGEDWFLTGLAGGIAFKNIFHKAKTESQQKLIAEISNSLVFSVMQEYFSELLKNSYDALQKEGTPKSQLIIKIIFQKQGDHYEAIWNDNGKGWDKLSTGKAIPHQELFDVKKGKQDSHKDHHDLGGMGLGMQQMYEQLIPDSDPKATITWKNSPQGGILITLRSTQSNEALLFYKNQRELDELKSTTSPVLNFSKMNKKLAKKYHNNSAPATPESTLPDSSGSESLSESVSIKPLKNK